MGRADQTTKIRGMFVHPGQVHAITRRFPEVVKARLVVSGEMANDAMTLQVETACSGPDSLIEKIGAGDPRSDQAARRRGTGVAGQPAQ